MSDLEIEKAARSIAMVCFQDGRWLMTRLAIPHLGDSEALSGQSLIWISFSYSCFACSVWSDPNCSLAM